MQWAVYLPVMPCICAMCVCVCVCVCVVRLLWQVKCELSTFTQCDWMGSTYCRHYVLCSTSIISQSSQIANKTTTTEKTTEKNPQKSLRTKKISRPRGWAAPRAHQELSAKWSRRCSRAPENETTIAATKTKTTRKSQTKENAALVMRCSEHSALALCAEHVAKKAEKEF